MAEPGFVVFINGTYGVGKTAVLDHIGDLLAEAGTPFALMDVDWFHRSSPPAADDPDNVLTEAANMAAVWTNYRAAGARQLVVSGVIAGRADLERYTDALGAPIRSVRLVADPREIESRLRRRYTSEQQRSLEWHLGRHGELAPRLADADLDQLVVNTSGRTPRVVALDIVRHFRL